MWMVLQGHIDLILKADLAAAAWANPRDGCDLAAAARAKAAAATFSLHTALHGHSTAQHLASQTPSQGAPADSGDPVAAATAALKAAATHALEFVDELPAALQRAKKLQRSQLAAAGVAHACADLVGVALAAPEGGAAAVAGVGKAALKAWEALAVGVGAGGLPATLLASCCRVRLDLLCAPYCCVGFHMISQPLAKCGD